MIQLSKSLSAIFALAMLLFGGCATKPEGPVAITKVNPYHLQPGPFVRSEDEMIVHEHRRLLHGAINSEEYAERMGNYFSIFWNSKDKNPATVRFQYCQAMT